MLVRTCKQQLEWIDLNEKVLSERTIITWKLFGIPIRKRVLEVESILPDGTRSKKIGFNAKP